MKTQNNHESSGKIRGKAGIKLIATEAGCSVSTVSRIMNNYKNFRVSKDVRAKVIKTANKYNYSPHPILRTIRAQKTWMVSLLDCNRYSHDMEKLMRSEFVSAMLKTGYQVGSNFLTNKESAPEVDYYPDWSVDGVAFTNACRVDNLARLDDSGIPYVSMNGVCGTGGEMVLPDEALGMKLAVDYLASLGHRKIAYSIHELFREKRPSAHLSVAERESNYLDEMRRNSLEPVPGWADSWNSMQEYLKATVIERGATAIIGYNLFTGVALLQAAWQLGIPIPLRLSVLCFDDLYPSEFTIPALTCVRLPAREIGKMAAEVLLKMLEEPEMPRGNSHKLPCSLTIRESTAPVGRKAQV